MRYQISIGSNTDQEINFSKAHQALDALFPDIRYSSLIKTVPLGMHNQAVFYDQIAQFSSTLPTVQLIDCLKQIEREIGRKSSDKAQEIIKIDIDLLASEVEVFKQEDFKRTYVQEGLAELNKKDMKFLGLIPARYASTRFPAKPLAMLGGKPVIQRVYEQVVGCVDEAYVATDDERIAQTVQSFGGKVVMTSSAHRSGTDRCREAAMKVGGDYDVVICKGSTSVLPLHIQYFTCERVMTMSALAFFMADDHQVSLTIVPDLLPALPSYHTMKCPHLAPAFQHSTTSP